MSVPYLFSFELMRDVSFILENAAPSADGVASPGHSTSVTVSYSLFLILSMGGYEFIFYDSTVTQVL